MIKIKYLLKNLRTLSGKTFFKYKFGSNKDLNFIHIGKCGGSTICKHLINNKFLLKKFRRIFITHVDKPIPKKKTKYLICIRNPIERVISAFYFRYKLIVEDKYQVGLIDNEYEVLNYYKSMNKLSERLYSGNNLNKKVAEDFRTIHHLKEDISFYINELLNEIKPEQIYGVICMNTLNEDIKNYLGVKNNLHLRKGFKKDKLSKKARLNLKRFLKEDYRCVDKLNRIFNLKKKQYLYLKK